MKTTAQPIVLVGGVNLNKDPRVIRPDQLALAKNAFPIIPGILGKREGMTAYGIAINTSSAYGIVCLDIAKPPVNTELPYVAHLHKMHVTDPTHMLVASTFDKQTGSFTGGITQALGPGQTEYEPIKFVNYRGLCIAIVPGEEGYWVLQPQINGTYLWTHNTFNIDPAILTLGFLAGVYQIHSQSIAVTPRTACQYKQRMVWGNFGKGKGNWICFADSSTASVMSPLLGVSLMSLIGTDALSLNGRHVEVGSIENEDIVAMQEITLASMGSQIDSVLMLLTDKTCVFISGEILQLNQTGSTDPNGLFGTYKENRINYECGCVSEKTLVKTPYGWIWAASDDVWMLQGNTPVRIGTNIRPALLNTPPTARKHWSAAYANGVYVLQLATQTTTIPAGGNDAGDMTSYIYEYWYLDLRDGPPQGPEAARWFGPMSNDNLDGTNYSWIGPLLSDRGADGRENVRMLGGFPASGVTSFIDLFGSKLGYDAILNGEVTANKWQASTQYAPGDIVRPTNTVGTAGKTGAMHVCRYLALPYDNQSGNFTIGDFIIGGTSGASGQLVAQVDNGSDGTLVLTNIVPGFLDNEPLIDAHTGAALVNGQLGLGTTGNTEPTWATPGSGSDTTGDGSIVWQEILGTAVSALNVFLQLRGLTDYTTDIRARDSALNDGVHEKLLRRLDVNAAANGKIELSAFAIKDQGSMKALGTNVFGGSAPELGSAVLPFEIAGLKSTARAFRPDEGTLIQGRQMQVKIEDETSFIIDDSNDTLVLMAGVNYSGIQGIQVQIAQGAYASIDAIMTAIVARLNVHLVALETVTGWSLTQWRFDSAYSSTFPYFTRLVLEQTVISGPGSVAIVGGSSNQTQNVNAVVGDSPTTLYLPRSKRLMALLGYMGENAVQFGQSITFPSSPTFDSTDCIFVFGFETASNDILIDGGQCVQRYNSQRFDIESANMILQPKTAVPLRDTDRS